ncbi:hypothetical protein JCM5353_003820 [Sporobolomyces roseus]
MTTESPQETNKPITITPELAIDLRLRFLESLISPTSSTPSISTDSTSLARRVSLIESQLKQTLESGASTEAVRRFVQNYDLNSPLLSVAPLPLNPPDSNDLSTQAKISLILEAEHDIRSLERDLRDIEILNQRGVVEAGKLPEHEALKGPVKQLETDARPVAAKYASLEARTNTLLRNYNDYITNLSELFVSWNDLVTEAEETVTKLEKERNQPLDIS